MNRTFFFRPRPVIVLLMILSAMLPAAAQELLTLEKAREYARENSADVETANLEQTTADLEANALKYDWYPDLSANAGAGKSGSPESFESSEVSKSAGISVKQQLWDGGTSGLERKLAGVQRSSANFSCELSVQEAQNTCDQLFFGYLEAKAREETALADLELARTLLQEGENKYETGILTRASYLSVKADEAASRTSLLAAKNDSLIAGTKLKSFLGLETLPGIRFSLNDYSSMMEEVAVIEDTNSAAVLSTLIEYGSANAPSLLQASLNVDKARINAKIQNRDFLPSVNLTFSDSFSFDENDEIASSLNLSVSASLNLTQWDWKNTREQGEIAVRTAAISSNEEQRNYTLKIESAWYELLSAARTVASAKTADEYARESYKETKQMYDLSAKNLSDMNDAKAKLVSNRNTYITACFDFLQSLSDLVYILGLKDEMDLWEIISK